MAPKWVKANRVEVGALMGNRQMTGEAWRVLGGVLTTIDWENESHISTQEIMIAQSMTQQQVSRALRRLTRIGVVIQGTRGVFRLNRDYFGAGTDQKDAYHARRTPQKKKRYGKNKPSPRRPLVAVGE